MKASWISAFFPAILLAGSSVSFSGNATEPIHSSNVLAGVQNLTRIKILESNNVTLRPGSVYDTASYYEVLLGFPQPGFNYEFLDAGLGAAEPVYPMHEKGHQASYTRLIPSFFSNDKLHIDSYATVDTVEDCRVDSTYLSRSMTEYPATEFKRERDEGFTIMLLRLDYYTRLRPDAKCGRHLAHDPDPNFDPMKFIETYHDAMYLSDFPHKDLARFEAKAGVLHQVRQDIFPTQARFDLNRLVDNSLWYYPQGHEFDFGISQARPQYGMSDFNLPRHMVIEATPETQAAFPLASILKGDEFRKLLSFWSGQPTADFDAEKEPGRDTFRLSDVTQANVYTSGLYIENIKDVVSDVSDPGHFKLVAMSIKPYEQQDDIAWEGLRVVPQIHFVYQLMDPRQPDRPFEQLYLHLKWDVVDRLAGRDTRRKQHLQFLSRVDELTHARETQAPDRGELVRKFIADLTSARPIEQIAFSSSLSGIWVFGALTRDQNQARELLPMRIIRDGIDLGYYSTVHDNDVFRAEAEKATGPRKKELQQLLDDLTVGFYRDPKRQNVTAINFHRVSCAQCHQTSGRDGVHFSFNDELNEKIKSKVYVTEFFFHDADEQLKTGMTYWTEAMR
ncbi:MAG: hypothetical protein WA820_22345 [Bradyrhizobium sp.]